MKEEIRIFFTALMFYTRIPCPKNIDHSPDYINKATRYFPLMGWIVGGVSFLLYFGACFVFDPFIAVIFSLIGGVLITGAFHEDGLADVFDGFGGGWSKSDILNIMKDSQIGAFGAIALILLFLLKFMALVLLVQKFQDPLILLILFIGYHSLSRLTAVNIVFTSEYSREDEKSKAKPIAKAHGMKEILGSYIFGLMPLAVLMWFEWKISIVLLPLFLLYFLSKRYFEKWIDGYTGDCLGAVEQLGELVCLLTFIGLWKFI
ncbi:MAG: adenosylcobinamide-GDP ribazoletransferase [Crocinitomicaceae bacterium]|nr:adenosylcobinamide-GDP ribazoletransferase [Crocinitomicaceae bacterium]